MVSVAVRIFSLRSFSAIPPEPENTRAETHGPSTLKTTNKAYGE
jgi:hypothetical protein